MTQAQPSRGTFKSLLKESAKPYEFATTVRLDIPCIPKGFRPIAKGCEARATLVPSAAKFLPQRGESL